MKLSHKIYAIIAVFCVPLIIAAVYFIVTGVDYKIDFALREKDGDAFQRPLESLLEHVSQHQVLAARYLSDDKSVKGDMESLRTLIGKDFELIAENTKKYGEELEFTDAGLKFRDRANAKPDLVLASWKSLASNIDKLSADDSNKQHNDLTANIGTMIAHSGDNSYLILDPIMITYYTSSITLGDLPSQQTRMTGAVARAMAAIEKKSISADDRRQLIIDADNLKSIDIANVESTHASTAYQYDSVTSGPSAAYASRGKLKAALEKPIGEFKSTTTELSDLLTKIASSDKVDTEPAKLQDAFDKARTKSFGLESIALDQLDGLLQQRADGYSQDRYIAIVLVILALLICSVISIFFIRHITQSIEKVAGELHELASAEADLTRRMQISSADEVGRLAKSFNSLMDKLLILVKQVQQSGTQVTSSSTQIAASTKELEAAVTEQASSTNEVVATTKEISATSQTLVQTMNEVAKVASETATLAGGGHGDLEGMETTMQQLAHATTSISSKLAAISDKANNINKVVVTITKVADQTNLLSLNASIEAEKAGEHGLGFAVVAREIRRLADQTAVATLDIERMVREMQSAVSTGVMEMDKFTKDVTSGVDEVNKIGAQLNKIIERVQALAPRFEIVTDGMQAQSQGAQQISTAMVQLSEAARQTIDSLRQTNGAISELNSAARGLHHEVLRFNTSGVAAK